MSLKPKPSTSPITPAEPSTAPTRDVALSRSSATTTPAKVMTIRTVLRSRPSMYGLLLLKRFTTRRCRLAKPPSQLANSTISRATSSSGALATRCSNLSWTCSSACMKRSPRLLAVGSLSGSRIGIGSRQSWDLNGRMNFSNSFSFSERFFHIR
jgi:hypothetical protein